MTTATPAESAGAARPPRHVPHKGDPGVWAFVLHRITGAAIFFFLFVHVLDTALVRVGPQTYTEVIALYKTPVVALMEWGLVAAVLYHGLNGIRVILIDSWRRGARHQRAMLWVIAAVWLVAMVPATVVIGVHMMEYLR